MKEGVDVVIGTPGRVAHLVEVGKLETRDLLAVVVDECDVLLGDSFEFAEQVRPLKEACETQGGCFTRFVLVTATIPEDVLRQLRAFFDGSLKVLQGPGLHRPAAGLLERLVDCSGGDVVDDQSGFYRKYRALEQLLDAEREKGEAAAKRMLLFCNKIETCRRVETLIALAVRPDARAPGARSRDETIDPSSLGIRARPRSLRADRSPTRAHPDPASPRARRRSLCTSSRCSSSRS